MTEAVLPLAAGGGAFAGASTGRRRAVADSVNADLCAATTHHFSKKYMGEFLDRVVTKGPNAEKIEKLATKIAKWSAKMAKAKASKEEDSESYSESADNDDMPENRRLANEWEAYAEMLDERPEQRQFLNNYKSKFGAKIGAGRGSGYASGSGKKKTKIPFYKKMANKMRAERMERLTKLIGIFRKVGNYTDLVKKLPSNAFTQAAGYAAVLAQLAKGGNEKNADLFAVNSKGDPKERLEACASVVNGVNAAVEDGEVAGLAVEEDGDKKIVVVTDDDLAAKFGKMFGMALTTVTLASGAVVMKLMDICNEYAEFVSVA